MKKDEVPQDKSSLESSNYKELTYAVNEEGEYTTELSSGWEPKTIALNNALEEIEERIAAAKEAVQAGEMSPIYYYMEKNKMDFSILASYVGIWKWRVKRHCKPNVFKKLSEKTLQKYAEVFQITIAELKKTD
ncbi:MAG: hypothetical protein CMC35_05100 [Flavobacteriaceae bacterium]|uniref:hypothetical protein n=1 Tax=Leeuwenhoekiella sp. UBA1003 TaxID=1946744 RepID=UPI000C892532|nr:hypothetical protein [Leeuwenhoekiella sp. UBA1003]MAT90050.1 hypothetical protein [Flavobacteriaceae bacterium]|tara:strand:- start:3817 stop:4215 length:399 start_codon:yes stop_codon:yes gene_type:complete